jgi:hypothetical protein
MVRGGQFLQFSSCNEDTQKDGQNGALLLCCLPSSRAVVCPPPDLKARYAQLSFDFRECSIANSQTVAKPLLHKLP